ncbi:MAG TPA: SDR family oxidoreductase [Pseudorhodoplanes sp.]|nr:SDR family oxidoreductase [Pseudorhodoplanes sp.]
MDAEFTGKVVVVTGGSRGIGRAIAAAFAGKGAQTVLAAMSADSLAAAAKAIAKTGAPEPMIVAGDLRTLAACETVHARVREKFGRCDILVNNAGATKAGAFLDLADDLWIDGFALKYFACARMSRLFWPMLKDAKGHVVNIIGGAARTPDPNFLIGGSVNAAMSNFSKGLSQLGKREGVNVNVIHPGITETDRVTQIFAARAAAAGKTPEEIRAQALKDGMCQPDDVAALAVFLCSAQARHIQGTAIAVDGGATPGFY